MHSLIKCSETLFNRSVIPSFCFLSLIFVSFFSRIDKKSHVWRVITSALWRSSWLKISIQFIILCSVWTLLWSMLTRCWCVWGVRYLFLTVWNIFSHLFLFTFLCCCGHRVVLWDLQYRWCRFCFFPQFVDFFLKSIYFFLFLCVGSRYLFSVIAGISSRSKALFVTFQMYIFLSFMSKIRKWVVQY